MAFDNFLCYLVNINVYAKFHHNIPLSSRDRAIFIFFFFFFFFQNLELSKASTDDKCHFAISWAKPCQYQFVCKSLSNDSKWFTSYRHFPLFGRGQNLHKLSGDKIKCLIIGHTLKVNLQPRLTFLRSCNVNYK